MRSCRVLGFLGLLVLVVSPGAEAQELGQLQRESLSRVFFSNNPLPPEPTAEEIEITRRRCAGLGAGSAVSYLARAHLLSLYPDLCSQSMP
jgi:hypothetical protein